MAVKLHTTETTVGAAIGDAYSQLQELRDEVREAYENMPESLQGGPGGEARQECADALDSFCDDDPSDDLPASCSADTLQCVYGANRRRSRTRSDRRDEAVRMLHSAADALEEWCARQSDQLEDGEDMTEDLRVDVEAAEEVISRLREHADEADGVEFPGR